jgi:hypothetical protein
MVSSGRGVVEKRVRTLYTPGESVAVIETQGVVISREDKEGTYNE